MREPLISFRDFSFQYRSLSEPTLKNITLDIYPGEKILIAGPSGSGKSTLAHCINGLIPFTYGGTISGEYSLQGRRPADLSIFEISRSVGTILQDQDGQFIGLSVGEDVAFAFENDCMPVAEMKPKVARALEIVDMLPHIGHSPHELSGGQKQRVSLAGVLSMEAGVLLFDEPLANLDPASGKHAMALIEDIHQQTGKTILIIEHRVEDVLEQPVDRIVIMAEGRIVRTGTPDEILASSVMSTHGLREPLYVTALKYAGCELAPEDRPSSLERVSADPDNRFRLAAFAAAADSVKPLPDREPLVEMDNVRYSYDGEREVIRGVSLTIGQGERLALLGNNGAGKSTLSHLLTGIAKPSSGSIRLLGEDTRSWSIRRLGQQIGYVMQNPNHMITQAMIWDEVALGLRVRGLGEEDVSARVEETLRICGLYGYREWPISALSYGQKKRVTIASILALEPRLMILDEPTAGQDYKHYTEFMSFISRLADSGLSFLFITHDMHLALEYTERAAVLCDGAIIACGETASVLTDVSAIARANLKETSLGALARLTGAAAPEMLVRDFIAHEKKVNHHE
ncbi:ABC transporter ATP-binding protein [Paenibacillus thiaminolyticus]|uniref:ABC transporter ATP-binding protein n=1 Tax=Paenibacillus thiaminolyticus TaxID=49283 RepID=A0AAP9DUV4_PANTH|nr:ABC transporter ATP-binding protein [Paenibacillus thiaminolyticus]MCY9535141.1 ABC transporter ATP-binding protein [Paenibacillus thiaminolyticus]MCY9602096.1 ABC transporter ATP-binding protein [Paenibacillus thiaminolyticus]MCY9608845.1 ABC transporter ATP-binding protein [Paenibacillus thiaminolyticus]MCY9614995.1 ABC transporter ATP-binding protein [Paenibacillus thiaminolyticus]MCY9618441.1 ABC transporter ATP-binding protein [Paenibacillus thiaminolyticus]